MVPASPWRAGEAPLGVAPVIWGLFITRSPDLNQQCWIRTEFHETLSLVKRRKEVSWPLLTGSRCFSPARQAWWWCLPALWPPGNSGLNWLLLSRTPWLQPQTSPPLCEFLFPPTATAARVDFRCVLLEAVHLQALTSYLGKIGGSKFSKSPNNQKILYSTLKVFLGFPGGARG